MKSARHYSQAMYLFVIYSIFILTLLGIFFIFTYTHYQKTALEEASRDLENMCASVENSVKTQLDNISTISMNVVYSNAIKKNFKEFSSSYKREEETPEDIVTSREKAMAIHDIVTAIIGAYQTASGINLYTMDGYCVEAGYWLRTTKVDLKSLPWYEETMALNGHKYISEPVVRKDLPAKGENQKTQKFISLVRLFLDLDGQPEGIVEVVQDCDKIFSLASQLENQNPDSRVMIYNSRNEMVYPYQYVNSLEDSYPFIEKYDLSEKRAKLIRTEDGKMNLFTYQKIQGYDWTVILTKPQAVIYESLQNFRLIFSLIGAVSILFTLLICFYISQRLTKPLQKLTEATGKITINRVLDENKVNLTSADSNIEELSQLCESIRTMYEKLRTTSQEVLLSKSEETRAKLQATQSLINPHFLYNSLTNISIMAEEEMNEDIVKMCQSLCDYFRYISSSKEMMVPISEEIFYTERYLECMQMRFLEEFAYTMNISAEIADVLIPKLIIQPIVENAFKYAFDKTPPWKLEITATLEDDCWNLRVQDNGGNLREEKKEELMHLYKNLDLQKELQSLEIGGMGLKNVYLRLKLLYGDKAIFKIENTLPQKTIFILGGPIKSGKESSDE